MKSLLFAIVALALSGIPASAVVLNASDIGASGTTTIQGQIDGTNVAGLTGTLFLKLDGFLNAGKTWVFDYTVKTTSGGAITASRISSFGLSTTPDIVGGASTGVYGFLQIGPNGVPGFILPTIDFCAGSSANTCTGGNGLTLGQSASGTLALTFATALSLINLDTAYMRFQSIVGSRLGDSGAGVNGPSIELQDITPTPLPGAAIMFFSGLTGLGLLMRRRKRIASLA
jgi:hypothetical protein